MSLTALGFDSRFAFAFDEGASTFAIPLHPARIVRADRGRIVCHDGTTATSRPLTGHFISNPPIVGDFVGVDNDTGRILFVVERRQLLERRRSGSDTEAQSLAANVDAVWLAAPADRFNLSWIERAIRLVRDTGAKPVIVVTKADLLDGRNVEKELFERHLFEDIVLTRSDDGSSFRQLLRLLPAAQTAVLLGPSGAGKSTMLNALLGDDVVGTGHVRQGDSKGRHTTVRRELHILPSGGLLIDTPGTRELGFISIGDDDSTSFDDIDTLALDCRFQDCAHLEEPGCAVQNAVDDGSLPQDRYNSFQRQERERRHLTEKFAQTDHAKRERERRFAKMVKDVQRVKRSKSR
ncbi:MAG: ribosome small subunit-dependent GTPase A [Deltaproteobacteria bacterium]|nr:ribosome small subunit-dependent GTPase A [Deltaproteobacteria bacterium]